jgi:predicted GNAT family acetyltransferase
MTDLTITHHPTAQGGEFVATLPDTAATGRLTYATQGPVLIADHTLVPSAIGGRGVAARLVDALIDHARANDLRIAPHCSYVAIAFRRHPEWADLLA